MYVPVPHVSKPARCCQCFLIWQKVTQAILAGAGFETGAAAERATSVLLTNSNSAMPVFAASAQSVPPRFQSYPAYCTNEPRQSESFDIGHSPSAFLNHVESASELNHAAVESS